MTKLFIIWCSIMAPFDIQYTRCISQWLLLHCTTSNSTPTVNLELSFVILYKGNNYTKKPTICYTAYSRFPTITQKKWMHFWKHWENEILTVESIWEDMFHQLSTADSYILIFIESSLMNDESVVSCSYWAELTLWLHIHLVRRSILLLTPFRTL
jgi:hypothetical protein